MNFDQLVTLCQRTHEEIQKRALHTVDLSLVVRNWLFGWYIVEFEQEGADRAVYGQLLVQALADRLKEQGIKGVASTNLKLSRQFYLAFRQIGQTASDQFAPDSGTGQTLSDLLVPEGAISPARPKLPVESNFGDFDALFRRFTLGWSHYVELLTLDDPAERHFYEIEAAANQWSVRELRRQIDASLYERLSLSRDKDEIRRLATEGQVVEKAADLIKNPLRLQIPALSAIKRRTQSAAGNDHPGTRTQFTRNRDERRGTAMNAQSLTISLRVSAPPREGLLWRASWT